ncbi:MAG: hypothetical protein A3C90_01295 [Candidatus Magasanikbacteria bacterium RIFCSPHIGHO2_02_FULL_51_14]|uniref:Uncharacterized protein n=1 Tax=Candidatus Magasanikbacteria bacterium RIFCSPHIGHO2_02_FULL_51_14 TaxID=1798683 RepID=A0A1F6MQB9_9BACT|nr:MAG: hypothetical protein A3C90_01295 [Candidatus Magasanikbacteria bacterium RIFCSPHIGHO2_02_FULL_51_14]
MVKNTFLAREKSELDKPVTVGVLMDTLVEYTDQILIPRLEEMMDKKIVSSEVRLKEHVDKKIAGSEHRMMTYIDRKLTDSIAGLFKRLDAKYQKEKQFREKVVELLKRHNIGTSEDIAYLEGLAQGI